MMIVDLLTARHVIQRALAVALSLALQTVVVHAREDRNQCAKLSLDENLKLPSVSFKWQDTDTADLRKIADLELDLMICGFEQSRDELSEATLRYILYNAGNIQNASLLLTQSCEFFMEQMRSRKKADVQEQISALLDPKSPQHFVCKLYQDQARIQTVLLEKAQHERSRWQDVKVTPDDLRKAGLIGQ